MSEDLVRAQHNACYRGDMLEKLNNKGKLIDINIIQLFGLVWRQNKPSWMNMLQNSVTCTCMILV